MAYDGGELCAQTRQKPRTAEEYFCSIFPDTNTNVTSRPGVYKMPWSQCPNLGAFCEILLLTILEFHTHQMEENFNADVSKSELKFGNSELLNFEP